MKALHYILILCLLGFASCNKDLEQQEMKYQFSIDSKVSPVKETYSLGETIWFDASFPIKVLDQISKSEVDLPSSGTFSTTMSLGRIDKSSFNSQIRYGILFAVDNFEFVSEKGRVTNPPGQMAKEYYRSLLSTKEDGMFKIKIGIKCKTKGIFALSFPGMGMFNWGDDTYYGEGIIKYEEAIKGKGYSLIKDMDVFNGEFISQECFVFKVE